MDSHLSLTLTNMYQRFFCLIVLCICFYHIVSSQDLGVIDRTNCRSFQLEHNGEQINFIKLDQNIDEAKPIILILQGSLPIPLIIDYPQGMSYTSFPYTIPDDVLDSYHLIVISMPDIPIVVSYDRITPQGTYLDPPQSYNQKNYLQRYVDRANAVVNYLISQPWYDSVGGVSLFGHSQGSYVAIKVANVNSSIQAVGATALSPHGRYQQYLSQVRYAEHNGQLSPEEAQAKINDYYDRWRHISQNRFDDSQLRGDTFKATYSFSESFVDDLLALKDPVYISYGTKDIGSLGCDLLPIEFERAGKKDYIVKAYPGLGHNFEEIDAAGNSQYDKMHWDEVFNSFTIWLGQQ